MAPVAEGALVEWEGTQKEVWGKRLADGHSAAVVLLNLDDTQSMNVSVSISALGLSGPVAVRGLWARRGLPSVSATITAALPSHGTRMSKLTSASNSLAH